jgi:hypothetical protein
MFITSNHIFQLQVHKMDSQICVYELISLYKVDFSVMFYLGRTVHQFCSLLGMNLTPNKWCLVKSDRDVFDRVCIFFCKFHLEIRVPHT